MTRRAPIIAPIALAGAALAGTGSVKYTDPAGDVLVRRTDEFAVFGALSLPNTNLPDLTSLTISGWAPDDPIADPYTGAETDNADLVRIWLRLRGHVNPPGPIGIGGNPFDPYRFGINPVYGFIELDVDDNINTGGEMWAEAVYRFLANTGRFNAIPDDATAPRVPHNLSELVDTDFFTPPFFERSGAEFTLKFCGCFEVSHAPSPHELSDGDMIFEEDETMLFRGRFFQRAGGFQEASAAFGGTDFGLYDPPVLLRFENSSSANETTITLVYPLTQAGAAMLTGQPQQPIDLDVSNHTSVQEALQDIIDGASGTLTGATQVLTQGWDGVDPMIALDPSQWIPTAIVGTAYPDNRSPSLYVYTDTGFNAQHRDLDGNGFVTPGDYMLEEMAIAQLDGGPTDADMTVNGEVALANFGLNFSLYDIDYDGFINDDDLALLPEPTLPGDLNGDGIVNTADLGILIANFGAISVPGEENPADVNGDGVVNTADLGIVIGNFGMTL